MFLLCLISCVFMCRHFDLWEWTLATYSIGIPPADVHVFSVTLIDVHVRKFSMVFNVHLRTAPLLYVLKLFQDHQLDLRTDTLLYTYIHITAIYMEEVWLNSLWNKGSRTV